MKKFMVHDIVSEVSGHSGIIILYLLAFVIVQAVVYLYFKNNFTFLITIAGAMIVSSLAYYAVFFATNFGVGYDELKYFSFATVATFAGSFLVAFLILLFLNYGVYFVVTFIKSGVFYKSGFYIWLSIFVVLAASLVVAYVVEDYLKLAKESKYVDSYLTVSYQNRMPLYFDEIKFENSSTKSETIIEFDNKLDEEYFYRKDPAEKYPDYVEIRKSLSIPVGTDRVYMSWYSFVEDKYYKDVFPFDYSKFADNIKDAYAPSFGNYLEKMFPFLRKKKISHVYMRFYLNGEVDFSRSMQRTGKRNVGFYIKVETEQVEEDAKRYFIGQYLIDYDDPALKEKFKLMVGNKKNVDEIYENSKYIWHKATWKIEVEGSGLHEVLSVGDVRMNSYTVSYGAISKPEVRPLPESIQIKDEFVNGKKWVVNITLDTNKLYDLIKDYPADKEITFKIVARSIKESDIGFFVVVDSNLHEFYYIHLHNFMVEEDPIDE